MIASLLLASCASVIPLYEEARTEALSDPGPPGARWQPDARIDLSWPVLDEILSALVVGTVVADAPIDAGIGSIAPRLAIRRFALAPDARGGDGLVADLRIEGPITVKTPLGSVEQQVAAEGRLVATLAVEPRDGGYAVVVHPKELRKLQVEADGLASQALTGSLRELVIAALPAFDVTELPAEDLPIRAVEIEPTAAGVGLRIRTAAPDGVPLDPLPAPPQEGFRVAVSAGSLVALARRQSFLADPLAHDVVAEPMSLQVAPGGDFVLGLRLWRPVGRGWWRTCEVKGSFRVRDGQLRLQTASVEELDQSPGADLVDPLMALAEGIVLKTMEKAMDLHVPAARTDRLGGGVKVATQLDRLEVVGQSLQAVGGVDLTARRQGRGGDR